MLKKFLFAFLIISFLFSPCFARENKWGTTKPPLGSQIDWSHPLSRGLVGCFLMNEGGGGKIGDLLNKTNGSIQTAPWIVGKDGPALNFSTTTYQVKLGDTNILDNATSCSFSFWIYPNVTMNGRIISKWGNENVEQSFLISTPGSGGSKIQFAVQRSASYVIKYTNNGLPTGVWSNVAITWVAENTVRIYFNGINQALTTESGGSGSCSSILNGNTQLEFGYETEEATASANMKLSNVQIWRNRVFSPQEIQQLYQEPYCFIKKTSWLKTAQAAIRRMWMVDDE